MTATEQYTSLKQFYKELMISWKWTLAEIDQLDAHFFFDVLETEEPQKKEKDVYLSDIW